jgi:hypothetical protein
MSNMSPENRVRIQEAVTRNEYACQIVAGFRSAMPALAETWDYLQDALGDVLVLDVLLGRLTGELDRTHLQRANLMAAMRAALAADADHEADPLWFLRDELDAIQAALSGTRASSWREP